VTAIKVAIVGATGAVGREMVKDLEESKLQDINLGLFASPRSSGTRVSFRGQSLEVKAFSPEALKGVRYVLMSAGGAFSREHARTLVAQGATVIDNSSAWRMAEDVPLVVPEVNADVLARATGPGIIANPNCSTIQMVVALKPLKDAFGLEMVQVATYQSVSGTGQKGITELSGQVEAHFRFQEPVPGIYAQPIAFNLLPAIDVFDDAGHCYEEVKMIKETRKILALPGLPVLATTVRVPTFNCHGEAVTVRLGEAVTKAEAEEAMAEGEGIVFIRESDHAKFPTPKSVVGDPRVFVSRLRLMHGEQRSAWLQFWNIADNLKKGAASNAVQILERLCN
jgi:aspartate-semialdehyde dehydrogenase